MKKLLFAALLLLASNLAYADGGCYNDMALKRVGAYLAPASGAVITVCNYTNGSCSDANKATLYSDASLLNAVGNPVTADNDGNYFFCVGGGRYTVQVVNPTNGDTFTMKDVSVQMAGVVDTSSDQSIGGHKTFTGEVTLSALSTKNVNGTRVADGFASLQAAHDDLPVNGGLIHIPAGNYTIPLGSIVITKPGVRFVCDSPNSTVLTFTGTTGNAFWFKYTSDPYGNVSQWGASIENCKIIGPGGIDGSGNAGTAIALGTSSLAPTGVRIINTVIGGFSKGITWGTGSAAYLEVAHSVFANNTQDLVYDAAVNAGTNATFDDVKFVNWSAPMVANKLVFSSPVGGKFVFKNCGFNNSQVVVSSAGMWMYFDNPTFENDEGNTTLNYYTQSLGTVVMKAPQFLQHFSSGAVPDAFVSVSGGAISVSDWGASTQQTMTSAFKFSGNVNFHVGRQVSGQYSGGSTGFTNDVASTSSGYQSWIDHRGSLRFFPGQAGELNPMLQVGRNDTYNTGEVRLPADLKLTGYSVGDPTAFISAGDSSGSNDLDLALRVQNAGTIVQALKLIHGTSSGSTVQIQDVLRLGASGPSVLNGSASTRNAVRTAYPSVSIGSIYLSTAGKMYLKTANAGADTDWQLVTSTAAD